MLSLALHPDGNHLVTGSSDKKIKLWSLGSRQCLHTVDDHSDQVRHFTAKALVFTYNQRSQRSGE